MRNASPDAQTPAPASGTEAGTSPPDDDQEVEGLSYSQMVWNQFQRHWENVAGLLISVFFFLLTLVSPFLSSNQPFYWSDGETVHFPWFRRFFAVEGIDFFYNMAMLAAVLTLFVGTGFLLARRSDAEKFPPELFLPPGLLALLLIVVPKAVLLPITAGVALLLWTRLHRGSVRRSRLIWWALSTFLLFLIAGFVTFTYLYEVKYGKRYSTYKVRYDGKTVPLKHLTDREFRILSMSAREFANLKDANPTRFAALFGDRSLEEINALPDAERTRYVQRIVSEIDEEDLTARRTRYRKRVGLSEANHRKLLSDGVSDSVRQSIRDRVTRTSVEGIVFRRADHVKILRPGGGSSYQTIPLERIKADQIVDNTEKYSALFPPNPYGHREQRLGSNNLSPFSWPTVPDPLKKRIMNDHPNWRKINKRDGLSIADFRILVMTEERFQELKEINPRLFAERFGDRSGDEIDKLPLSEQKSYFQRVIEQTGVENLKRRKRRILARTTLTDEEASALTDPSTSEKTRSRLREQLLRPSAYVDRKLQSTEAFKSFRRNHPYYMAMHLFGTDASGYDLFSHAVFGSRVSLAVGFVATSVSLLIGVILGAFAGYFMGLIDILISRILEVFMVFPRLMLIIALASFVENREFLIFYIMFILGLTQWPGTTRLIRGTCLETREEEFVLAARGLGAGNLRVIFGHVLPNAIHPLFVSAPFAVAGGIILEGGLALIGFGAQNYPSWGTMLEKARPVFQQHPHLIIIPVVAIFLAVTAFNLIGAGLRDAVDPKMKIGEGR